MPKVISFFVPFNKDGISESVNLPTSFKFLRSCPLPYKGGSSLDSDNDSVGNIDGYVVVGLTYAEDEEREKKIKDYWKNHKCTNDNHEH